MLFCAIIFFIRMFTSAYYECSVSTKKKTITLLEVYTNYTKLNNNYFLLCNTQIRVIWSHKQKITQHLFSSHHNTSIK